MVVFVLRHTGPDSKRITDRETWGSDAHMIELQEETAEEGLLTWALLRASRAE